MNLTIHLSLKNRTKYTVRLLKYLTAVECPFPIFIADGSSKLIEWDKEFSKLNIVYKKYPYDETLKNFQAKLDDSLNYINTDFVTALDNDDLPFLSGLVKSIQFLQQNPNYTSARGRLDKCKVSRGIYGSLEIKGTLYKRPSIIGDTASKRISEQSRIWHGVWLSAIWTKHLRITYKLLNLLQFEEFRFIERCIGYANSLWGNSHRDMDYPFLLHQSNSPVIRSSNFTFDKKHWVKSDYFISNFAKMALGIGLCISYCDKLCPADGIKSFCESSLLKEPEMNHLLKPRIQEAQKIAYNLPIALYDDILKYLEKVNPLDITSNSLEKDFYLSEEEELKIMRKVCLNQE